MDFWHEAQVITRGLVQKWIRAALRETALQSLRHSLLVATTTTTTSSSSREDHVEMALLPDQRGPDNNHDDEHPQRSIRTNQQQQPQEATARIMITSESIQYAQRLCALVANQWSQQLRDRDLMEVADWVQEIYITENMNLYYHDRPVVSSAQPPVRLSTDDESVPTITTTNTNLVATSGSDGRRPTGRGGDGGDGGIIIIGQPKPTGGRKEGQEDADDPTRVFLVSSIHREPVTTLGRLRQLSARRRHHHPVLLRDEHDGDAGGGHGMVVSTHDRSSFVAEMLDATTTLPVSTATAILDHWGTETTATTTTTTESTKVDWPFSWPLLIQRIARDIPARLYNRTSNQTQVTLVPKTLTAKQQQHQIQEQQQQQRQLQHAEPHNNGGGGSGKGQDQDQETDQIILDRKRKILGRPKRPPQANKKIRPTPSSAMMTDGMDVPRPPFPNYATDDDTISMGGNNAEMMRWLWDQVRSQLTEPVKRQLDTCVYPDELSTSNDDQPLLVLSGALQPLGCFHAVQQTPIDGIGKLHTNSDQDNGTQLEPEEDRQGQSKPEKEQKRQRRRQQQYIRERLGGHKEAVDYGATGTRGSTSSSRGSTNRQRLSSRVVRTTDEDGRRWLELDISHCLMEMYEPLHQDDHDDLGESDHGGGRTAGPGPRRRRHLYAFSSLEVMLMDEDASKYTPE